jgi:hypothetical protein
MVVVGVSVLVVMVLVLGVMIFVVSIIGARVTTASGLGVVGLGVEPRGLMSLTFKVPWMLDRLVQSIKLRSLMLTSPPGARETVEVGGGRRRCWGYQGGSS